MMAWANGEGRDNSGRRPRDGVVWYNVWMPSGKPLKSCVHLRKKWNGMKEKLLRAEWLFDLLRRDVISPQLFFHTQELSAFFVLFFCLVCGRFRFFFRQWRCRGCFEPPFSVVWQLLNWHLIKQAKGRRTTKSINKCNTSSSDKIFWLSSNV